MNIKHIRTLSIPGLPVHSISTLALTRARRVAFAVGALGLSAFVATAMLAPAAQARCFNPTTGVSMGATFGDINGSGTLNVVDALCAQISVLRTLAGQPPHACLGGADPSSADVNCDGVLNISDAQLTIKIALFNAVPAAFDSDADGCPDTCVSCGGDGVAQCYVEGLCFAPDSVNPADVCESCNVEESDTSWSVLTCASSGDPCAPAVCDPVVGCTTDPVQCADDGNECTDESCNPATGQCVSADSTGSCEDGDACTTGDVCAAGTCQPGTPVTCGDDGNPCTIDECDPGTGSCGVAVADGTSCEDGDACTTPDTCQAGVCQLDPFPPCFDGTSNAICVISGTVGEEVICPMRVVSESGPFMTGFQMNVAYPTSLKLLRFSDGVTDISGEGGITTSMVSFTFNPPDLGNWNGGGSMFVLNYQALPLTTATLSGGTITGDPFLVDAVFELQQTIPSSNPVILSGVDDLFLSGSDDLGGELQISFDGALMITNAE